MGERKGGESETIHEINMTFYVQSKNHKQTINFVNYPNIYKHSNIVLGVGNAKAVCQHYDGTTCVAEQALGAESMR